MLQVALAPTRTPLCGAGCAVPLDFYSAALLADVGETDLQRGAAEPARPRPRPLDEGDRVCAQEVVEQGRVLVLEALQAVEVEVGDRHPTAAVALADREGRRGDRRGDAEGAAGAADPGRLSGGRGAGEEDDVARLQARGDAGAEGFGLGGTRRFHDLFPLLLLRLHPKNPSWSLGGGGVVPPSSSASASSSALGTGPGSGRCSSSGIVAKSARSVSFTAGVRSAAAGWNSGSR